MLTNGIWIVVSVEKCDLDCCEFQNGIWIVVGVGKWDLDCCECWRVGSGLL